MEFFLYLILILTALIIYFLLSIFIYNLKFMEAFRKRLPEAGSFIVTLFATFIGVIFAFQLSSYLESQKEMNKAVNVLILARSNIIHNNKEIKNYKEYLYSDSLENIDIFYPSIKHNHDLFENLFKYHIVVDNISYRTYMSLLLFNSNIPKYFSMFENINTLEIKRKLLDMISCMYEILFKIFEKEIEYIHGNINYDELDIMIDSCYYNYQQKYDSIDVSYKSFLNRE